MALRNKKCSRSSPPVVRHLTCASLFNLWNFKLLSWHKENCSYVALWPDHNLFLFHFNVFYTKLRQSICFCVAEIYCWLFWVLICRRSTFTKSREHFVQRKVRVPRDLGFWGLAFPILYSWLFHGAGLHYVYILSLSRSLSLHAYTHTYLCMYIFYLTSAYHCFSTVVSIRESACSWWHCSVDWERWMCLPGNDSSSSPLFDSISQICMHH